MTLFTVVYMSALSTEPDKPHMAADTMSREGLADSIMSLEADPALAGLVEVWALTAKPGEWLDFPGGWVFAVSAPEPARPGAQAERARGSA